MRAAFEAEVAEAAEGPAAADASGGVKETCCMCILYLPNLGTLMYGAGNYSHESGSRHAHWQCEQNCYRQCRHVGRGEMFSCYDEDHVVSASRTLVADDLPGW